MLSPLLEESGTITITRIERVAKHGLHRLRDAAYASKTCSVEKGKNYHHHDAAINKSILCDHSSCPKLQTPANTYKGRDICPAYPRSLAAPLHGD